MANGGVIVDKGLGGDATVGGIKVFKKVTCSDVGITGCGVGEGSSVYVRNGSEDEGFKGCIGCDAFTIGKQCT